MSSSIQAELDNTYGRSKKAGEDLLFAYSKETGVKVLVYRLPNVFGKWCKPNYNSAVATFCYNIAHNLPITVNDPTFVMNLVHIDDVVEELISALQGEENCAGQFCEYQLYIELAWRNSRPYLLFKQPRSGLFHMKDSFTKKLYSTYLSYCRRTNSAIVLK